MALSWLHLILVYVKWTLICTYSDILNDHIQTISYSMNKICIIATKIVSRDFCNLLTPEKLDVDIIKLMRVVFDIFQFGSMQISSSLYGNRRYAKPEFTAGFAMEADDLERGIHKN